MRAQTAVILAALLTASFPCVDLAELPRPTVKLKIIQGLPVVDGVYLNAHGPYRFLLDTGSQTNQLEAGVAQKLGLPATLQLDLHTPSGLSQVQGGKVSKVSLGPVEAADQELIFTNLDGLHALSPDIRGILGQEFLAHFDYTLDFQNHLLTFGDPPVAGTRVTVRRVYGCMTLPTSLGDLMLDSGIDTLFLFRESSRPPTAHVSSATGLNANVSLEAVPELRIGDRRYHPVHAAVQYVAEAPEAGLLPASLFRAIFISNSEGYVVFNPETRR